MLNLRACLNFNRLLYLLKIMRSILGCVSKCMMAYLTYIGGNTKSKCCRADLQHLTFINLKFRTMKIALQLQIYFFYASFVEILPEAETIYLFTSLGCATFHGERRIPIHLFLAMRVIETESLWLPPNT